MSLQALRQAALQPRGMQCLLVHYAQFTMRWRSLVLATVAAFSTNFVQGAVLWITTDSPARLRGVFP